MASNFTDRARRVVERASEEARLRRHEYVGTEHLLLALLHEETSVAVRVLESLTIDPRRVASQIDGLIQPGIGSEESDRLPLIPRAKRVIELALEEAGFPLGIVGTEHILLGLMREEEGVAARVLVNLGLTLDTVRAEIERVVPLSDWERKRPAAPVRPVSDQASPSKPPRPPDQCPRCGGTKIVRVIWDLVHLFGQDLDDVSQGRAIIACLTRPKGPSFVRFSWPSWACLDCSPRWSDLHEMSLQDYQLQVAKERAISEQDFNEAMRCRDSQRRLRRQSERLLKELLT